jgi:ABC-type multidrug transport system ATPase subunit
VTLAARDLHGGIVAGVDLVLGPGLTVVTGEPECGTSTLLRLLAGEQAPDRGSVAGGPVALLGNPARPRVVRPRRGVPGARGAAPPRT